MSKDSFASLFEAGGALADAKAFGPEAFALLCSTRRDANAALGKDFVSVFIPPTLASIVEVLGDVANPVSTPSLEAESSGPAAGTRSQTRWIGSTMPTAPFNDFIQSA
jgi:hypothetical protein